MKASTRLFLSRCKQQALKRMHDAGGLAASRKMKSLECEAHSNDAAACAAPHVTAGQTLSLEKVIEDESTVLLRINATLPLPVASEEGDAESLVWKCLRQDSSVVPCTTYVLSKRSIKGQADAGRDQGFLELYVSLRLPKEFESYLILVYAPGENDAANTPSALLATLIVSESELWRKFRENQLLVMSAQEDYRYPQWFAEHRTSETELARQRLASFSDEPIFSIIVPLYKTPLEFFHDMLASVETQTYPYWQLVLVNASPEDASLTAAVAQAAAREPRITIVTMAENLGITLNTNAGIRASVGDFLAFFDHDDVLEPDILFEYARAINEHPDTDMLYCDEDNLTPDGDFLHPFFKPDFSPDLLRCHNYMCHMLTVRKSLHDTLEPAGREFDGAQDHNCALRISEVARHVHHVPKVLYHWRVSKASVAENPDAKPYCTQAGILAVQQHIDRLGWPGVVGPADLPFRYRIRHEIKNEPLVSILIPSRDHVDMLQSCVDSILAKTTYHNYEIVILENGSTDSRMLEYYDALVNNHTNVRVEQYVFASGSFNFSELNNYGAQAAKGEYLLLLNNDTEVIGPHWLKAMLGYCQHKDVGAVGAKLLRRDGTIQHAGLTISGSSIGCRFFDMTPAQRSYFSLREDPQNLSAVTAACLMVAKADYLAIGGLDESFAVAYNDVDFCLRLRATGKLIVYAPDAQLYHHESVSRGSDTRPENAQRHQRELNHFKTRWTCYYPKGDPYYNNNLTQQEPLNCFYQLG